MNRVLMPRIFFSLTNNAGYCKRTGQMFFMCFNRHNNVPIVFYKCERWCTSGPELKKSVCSLNYSYLHSQLNYFNDSIKFISNQRILNYHPVKNSANFRLQNQTILDERPSELTFESSHSKTANSYRLNSLSEEELKKPSCDTLHLLNSSSRVLFSTSNVDSCSTGSSESLNDRGSSEENLNKIFLKLSKDLPEFFKKNLDVSIYHKDIVFDNRIRGIKTKGLSAYMQQFTLLKFVAHLRFSFVQLQVLKITKHTEDNTVRVRWKIIGMSPLKSMYHIFKLRSVKLMKEKLENEKWYDGFSVFHVGPDGLIHLHVADRMMPDEEIGVVKSSLTSRLASITGLSPKEPAVTNTSTQIMDAADRDRGPAHTLSHINQRDVLVF